MLKKITWKEDSVLNIKLRDDFYTLAQMRKNQLMQFFDIKNSDGVWNNIDLNETDPLFSIYVADGKLKPIIADFLKNKEVKHNEREAPKLMLNIDILPPVDSVNKFNVSLIELDKTYEPLKASTIKNHINPESDLEIIHSFETTGMQGSPEKLKKRLIRFFETGVNWDDQLSFIFPGIKVSPPHKKRLLVFNAHNPLF